MPPIHIMWIGGVEAFEYIAHAFATGLIPPSNIRIWEAEASPRGLRIEKYGIGGTVSSISGR